MGEVKQQTSCGCEHSFEGSIPAIQHDGDTFVRVADMYTMFASHIYLDIEQSFESLDTYESLDKYGFISPGGTKYQYFQPCCDEICLLTAAPVAPRSRVAIVTSCCDRRALPLYLGVQLSHPLCRNC